MALMKVRQNYTNLHLAQLFYCSAATVRIIVLTSINVLYSLLHKDCMRTIPSREKNGTFLPGSFVFVGNCRMAIDCTDIEIKIKKWLDINILSLNIDKTNFIIFKSPQHSSSEIINIKIGNLPVKKTCYVKFLGVLLDENLSWKYHRTELSKKLARTCGMFFKVRHFLPVDVLICLYNSLFSPFLQYGILVWGLTYETYINPVFLLQKRVVRAISFERFTSHSNPIFSDLKILKLHDLFQLKLLCFVYESVHKISPICFHNFFKSLESVHQYDTRQAGKDNIFQTQKNTSQYGLRSVSYYGAKCWNDIPVNIKRSPSVSVLRSKLKTYFFENNY